MKKLVLFAAFMSFTLSSFAQSACDSIDIHVGYAPFYDSMLQIDVVNSGTSVYNYPGFIVYNSNGDTVAKEEVSFFVIGGNSTHLLDLRPGMPVTDSFNGSLQLWSGFYAALECSYNNISIDLCPDTCVQVATYMINLGGALVLGNINWSIVNSASQVVASGVYEMIDTVQVDIDTVCLVPGNYKLHVDAATPSGGGPHVGMGPLPAFITDHPDSAYSWSAMDMPFQFYTNCLGALSVPGAPAGSSFSVYSNDGIVYISQRVHKPIGGFCIYSIDGRVVYRANELTASSSINLKHLPQGIYMVRLENEGRYFHEKIFIGD